MAATSLSGEGAEEGKSLAFLGQGSIHTSSLFFALKANGMGEQGTLGILEISITLCFH
jgi:hypothetical protein